MIQPRHFAAIFISAVITLPVISLLWIAVSAPAFSWGVVIDTTSLRALLNTVLLCTGVATIVTLVGVSTAWLVVAYDFKSKHVLSWALLLPLAVPTYIVAYSYLDLLHPLGPVQGLIREALGYSSPKEWKFGDIRGLTAAIILQGFVLYPYVYLSARAMFLTQPLNLLHAARSLGLSEFSTFWRVALPMARPAIGIGLSLALLETINDIGASEFLGVRTLTVAIYTNWTTKGDLAGGAKIALLLLGLILILAYFGRDKKRNASYVNARGAHVIQARTLKKLPAALACLLGWIPVLIGFIIPSSYLLYQVTKRLNKSEVFTPALLQAVNNTLMIAAVATTICIFCGIAIIWSTRNISADTKTFRPAQINSVIGKIGYAIPGTMLAIGLLNPYSWVDDGLNYLQSLVSSRSAGLFMLSSFAGVACACSIRFLSIAIGNFNAGMSRIPASLDQVARGLGTTSFGLLWRVHIPLIRPALIASTLLIFVECMKELPVTLMLRPINTETLSTLLYADASRGNYEESAIAALLIVAVGIIPVLLLTRTHLLGKKTK